MNTEDVHECEGSCLEHKGKAVLVKTESINWPAMSFWYCQNAIAEDEIRGFTVTIQTPQP